jgi:hypothetical protein
MSKVRAGHEDFIIFLKVVGHSDNRLGYHRTTFVLDVDPKQVGIPIDHCFNYCRRAEIL